MANWFKLSSNKPHPGEIRSLELQIRILKQKREFLPRQIAMLQQERADIPRQIHALETQLNSLRSS